MYNADFTAFQSFTPLSEDFSNSLSRCMRAATWDNWHTRVTLSRVIDDLRQGQEDPYAAAAGATSITPRATRSIAERREDSEFRLKQTLTFGAIVYGSRRIR